MLSKLDSPIRSARSSDSRRQEPSRRSPSHRQSRSDRGRSRSRTRRSRSSRRRSRSKSHSRHRHSYRRSPSRRRSPPPQHSRPSGSSCWVCGAIALPDKLACRTCLDEATREREASREPAIFTSLQIAESETSRSVQGTSPATPSTSKKSEPLSDNEDLEVSTGFDFSLIEPFIKSVKEAIEWEEEKETLQKANKYFPNLKKEPETFPFIEELEELIKDEWQKPEKKTSLSNRLAKLYPLKESSANPLVTPPVVDSSLMRLARHVTLPIEDATTFKDVLDRKIDLDLKRAYLSAGGACRPAITLAAVGRAISSWSSNAEKLVAEGVEQERVISALQELSLAGDFVAEASVDMIKSTSRAMLSSVMARRALWLKPWSADPSSKSNWCKIPFDGTNLFGEKLDSAISKVTGGKSGLIPSDRRPRQQRAPTFRRNLPDRYREAKSYKPGREYRKNWKNPQSSFLKIQKSKTPTPGEQKSF